MRKKLLTGFSVFASLALFSGISFADIQESTSNNSSIDIPDATTVGVPNTTNTITITDSEIIEEASFSIEGLSHTWAGDLVARVTHVESGRSVTLFSRIGKDNPNLGVGDDSNFQGDYIFSDATNNRLWDEAGRGATDYIIRSTAGDLSDPQLNNPGVYRATSGITNTGVSDVDLSINNTFSGSTTEGTWVLDLSDRNDSQVGSFREFTVNFKSAVAVPEPSTLVWLMAAGITGFGIRRYRS